MADPRLSISKRLDERHPTVAGQISYWIPIVSSAVAVHMSFSTRPRHSRRSTTMSLTHWHNLAWPGSAVHTFKLPGTPARTVQDADSQERDNPRRNVPASHTWRSWTGGPRRERRRGHRASRPPVKLRWLRRRCSYCTQRFLGSEKIRTLDQKEDSENHQQNIQLQL